MAQCKIWIYIGKVSKLTRWTNNRGSPVQWSYSCPLGLDPPGDCNSIRSRRISRLLSKYENFITGIYFFKTLPQRVEGQIEHPQLDQQVITTNIVCERIGDFANTHGTEVAFWHFEYFEILRVFLQKWNKHFQTFIAQSFVAREIQANEVLLTIHAIANGCTECPVW